VFRKRYTLHVYPDADQICRAAAESVVTLAGAAIAERGRFNLVLSGGSTPRRLYQQLAKAALRERVDWSKVEFFWGDERPVPPTSPDSNYGMAREALLEPLGIPKEHIHRMEGERHNLESAAQDYEAVIARVLGTSFLIAPPRFDLILLGMGPDGHTASLFPATPALTETHQWVVANPVLKFGVERLTLTPMVLNCAVNIHFLVTGADKAAIAAEVLEGPLDLQRLPAQLVRPPEGQVDWFLDEAAASKLKKR
jgi:6-phosphogluconolactonase